MALVGLVTLLMLVVLLVDGLKAPLELAPLAIRRAVTRLSFPFVAAAALWLTTNVSLGSVSLLFGLLFAPLLFWEFIRLLITHRRISGYIAKLDAQNEVDRRDVTLFDRAALSIGFKAFQLIFFSALVSLIAYGAGGFHARMQSDFIVLSRQPPEVVVKQYGEHFVVGKLNRATKTLSSSFRLIPIDSELGDFELDRIGPLAPEFAQ